MSCIARAELICLTNSGMSRIRMKIVRVMMARVHVAPESEPNTGLHMAWKSTTSPDTAQ